MSRTRRPSATTLPVRVPRWLFYEKIWFWLAVGLGYAAFSGRVEHTLFPDNWASLGPQASWHLLRTAGVGWGLSGLCTALALVAPRRFTVRFFRLSGEMLRLMLVITAPSELAARQSLSYAVSFSAVILGAALFATLLWTGWDIATGHEPVSLRPPAQEP